MRSQSSSKREYFKNFLSYYNFNSLEQKKYPVISGIFKEIIPSLIEKEIKRIKNLDLPLSLRKKIEEYEKIGEREEFVWKWLYNVIQITTFSSVDKRYLTSLIDTKFSISMFVILIDDVSDQIKNSVNKKRFLKKLLQLSCNGSIKISKNFSRKEREYFYFSKKLWRFIRRNIKKYPRFKEFQELFDLDFNIILNSMKYAFLVNNNPYLINEEEYWLHFPHSMQASIYATLDLMCSPGFDIKEVGLFRKIIFFAQKMVRIGNWISTWEREVKEKDFTSGIIAYAKDNGILTFYDLKKSPSRIIEKIHKAKIEKVFLKKWEKYYKKIKKLSSSVKSINIEELLSGLKKLLILEIISKEFFLIR